MATATFNPPEPVEQDVILTLSAQEASTLCSVLSIVATTSDFNTESIFIALNELGVKRENPKLRLSSLGHLVIVSKYLGSPL